VRGFTCVILQSVMFKLGAEGVFWKCVISAVVIIFNYKINEICFSFFHHNYVNTTGDISCGKFRIKKPTLY